MTTPADIAAAVLAERQGCLDACRDGAAEAERASDPHLGVAAKLACIAIAERIGTRPAPATDALERALRACAEWALTDRVGPTALEPLIQAAIAAGKGVL